MNKANLHKVFKRLNQDTIKACRIDLTLDAIACAMWDKVVDGTCPAQVVYELAEKELEYQNA